MDFADEPYVRLYTRKTLTWKLLGWEGRAVRNAMLDGEFDAAGIFAIQGDPAECISAVTDLPLEIVRVGLERLIRTKTWVVTAEVITWPNYEEAQNCRRSDRVRQRESRRARSAQAVTDVTLARPANVTDVTTGRAESPPVTGCHPPTHPPSAPTLPSEREDLALPEVPGLDAVVPTRRLTYFVPDDWKPKERHLARCAESKLDPLATESRFRKQEFNRSYSDWDRRFDLWIDDQRVKAQTERFKANSGPRASPRDDLDTTGAATAFKLHYEHRDFAERHLPPTTDLEALAREYRASSLSKLVGPQRDRDFLQRLKALALTGVWRADGPIPRPPVKAAKEARA
jgi:hypothetical protein